MHAKVFMDACVVLHARRGGGLRTLVMIAVGVASSVEIWMRWGEGDARSGRILQRKEIEQ